MEKRYFEGDWSYDIETYQNCFTCTFQYADGSDPIVFEISDRKNETGDFLEFLRKLKKEEARLIGYNNLAFDYPVIHWILQKAIRAKRSNKNLKLKAKQIYDKAMTLINSDGFAGRIPDNEIILPQVDLFKMNHFDNNAKRTSLKLLEFNMRSNNIEDLPFPVGIDLHGEEVDTLISYNKNDVKETLNFYYHCYDSLSFRQDLTAKYGFDCTNLNDTKIGEKFFMQRIEMTNPYAFYEPTGDGRRKMRQTPRSSIAVKDCIFPYIRFAQPEFKAVQEWLQRQIITETKGVFSDLEEHDLGEDLAKYAQMETKKTTFKNRFKLNGKGVAQNDWDYEDPTQVEEMERIKAEFLKLHPKAWFEDEKLNKTTQRHKIVAFHRIATTLNVVIDGFRYDFGTGGIHGSLQGTVHADDDYRIIDLDVR